jgi:hypothetical protein
MQSTRLPKRTNAQRKSLAFRGKTERSLLSKLLIAFARMVGTSSHTTRDYNDEGTQQKTYIDVIFILSLAFGIVRVQLVVARSRQSELTELQQINQLAVGGSSCE